MKTNEKNKRAGDTKHRGAEWIVHAQKPFKAFAKKKLEHVLSDCIPS